jgi:protein-disulfide isomerase
MSTPPSIHETGSDPSTGRNEAKHARRLRLDTKRLKADPADDAIGARVRADFSGGAHSGVNGTPTFFINGLRFDRNWTNEDELVAALEQPAG